MEYAPESGVPAAELIALARAGMAGGVAGVRVPRAHVAFRVPSLPGSSRSSRKNAARSFLPDSPAFL